MGELCFAIRAKNPVYDQFLKRYYKDFLTQLEPDLTIDLDVVGHNERIPLPDSILMSNVVKGNRFNFHEGLIEGDLDIKHNHCEVQVKEALFKRIRIFEHFLFQAYYTVIKNLDLPSFLVHGCAVSRDGYGFLFSGPSGSGKSTIASLSSEHTVLGDEIALIKKGKNSYSISATPFRGDYKKNVNESAPLKKVFLIKHGKRNEIIKISKREFVARFVREVIYPGTLLSNGRKDEFLDMMDFSRDIAECVPFYELGFLPDKSFWQCIDEINEGR